MTRESLILFECISATFGSSDFTFKALALISPGQCNTPSRNTLSRGLVTELVHAGKITRISGSGTSGKYRIKGSIDE